MEKLNQLEFLLKHEIFKTTQKQQQIEQKDPLKYQRIKDVINDDNLEIYDIIKYIIYIYIKILYILQST